MITEDYVSFEVAKLLKEKGFDVDDCEVHYDPLDHTQYEITLQMAMKWFREIHKIFINIIYENDGVFVANLKVPLKGVDCMIDNKHNCWLTYEQATEEAIKYCLNLI